MRCHSEGCHADRLLTAAIGFVRCGDVCEGFRHGDRRRKRRRTGLRSDAETSCASGVLVLEATEFGRLERSLLLGLAAGLFELQLLGRTVGLQAGFAIGLGLEGGLRSLRSELGRAAASDSPLREALGRSSSFGRSCFGSHRSTGLCERR